MKYRKKIWDTYVFDFDFLKEDLAEIREVWEKIRILSNQINYNKEYLIFDEKKEEELKILKESFNLMRKNIEKILKEKWIKQRNIFGFSHYKDKWIWKWKDSKVYQSSKLENYIYKESHSQENNLEYLKNKYLILKKYLWEIIPDSYFVYGELEGLILGNQCSEFKKKLITIQKKVKWKDLSKLSFEEKKDEKLLENLKNAHKKYILLKYFLNSRIKELWLNEKTLDLQLDLWALSDKDSFLQDDVFFLKNKLKSPNIMRDGKQIYFIDFWSWVWNEEKQKVFDYMMSDEVYKMRIDALKIYNLKIK